MHLFQLFEHKHVQDFCSIGSVESLNESILHWTAWLDELQPDAVTVGSPVDIFMWGSRLSAADSANDCVGQTLIKTNRNNKKILKIFIFNSPLQTLKVTVRLSVLMRIVVLCVRHTPLNQFGGPGYLTDVAETITISAVLLTIPSSTTRLKT
jgi:hypothetical protein